MHSRAYSLLLNEMKADDPGGTAVDDPDGTTVGAHVGDASPAALVATVYAAVSSLSASVFFFSFLLISEPC